MKRANLPSKSHIQEKCGVWLSVQGRSKLQDGSCDQTTLPRYGLTPRISQPLSHGVSLPVSYPKIGGKQSTLNMFFKSSAAHSPCKAVNTARRNQGKNRTQGSPRHCIILNHGNENNHGRVMPLRNQVKVDSINETSDNKENINLSASVLNSFSDNPNLGNKSDIDGHVSVSSGQEGLKRAGKVCRFKEGDHRKLQESLPHASRSKGKSCCGEHEGKTQHQFSDERDLEEHPCLTSMEIHSPSDSCSSVNDTAASETLKTCQKDFKSPLVGKQLKEIKINKKEYLSSTSSKFGYHDTELHRNEIKKRNSSELELDSLIYSEETEDRDLICSSPNSPSTSKDNGLNSSYPTTLVANECNSSSQSTVMGSGVNLDSYSPGNSLDSSPPNTLMDKDSDFTYPCSTGLDSSSPGTVSNNPLDSLSPSTLFDKGLDSSFEFTDPSLIASLPYRRKRKLGQQIDRKYKISKLDQFCSDSDRLSCTPVFDTLDDFTFGPQ